MELLGGLIALGIVLGSILVLLLTRRPGGGSALGCASNCVCKRGERCPRTKGPDS